VNRRTRKFLFFSKILDAKNTLSFKYEEKKALNLENCIRCFSSTFRARKGCFLSMFGLGEIIPEEGRGVKPI
jgi:hypothetical protein